MKHHSINANHCVVPACVSCFCVFALVSSPITFTFFLFCSFVFCCARIEDLTILAGPLGLPSEPDSPRLGGKERRVCCVVVGERGGRRGRESKERRGGGGGCGGGVSDLCVQQGCLSIHADRCT